jgi:hypothetical protein
MLQKELRVAEIGLERGKIRGEKVRRERGELGDTEKQSTCILVYSYLEYHTVTRPYAGFRHPDRMAPDSSVWGGKIIALYDPGICFLRFRSFP